MNSGPEPGFAHYEVTGILSTARQLARCRQAAGKLLRLLAESPDQRLLYGEQLRTRQRELFDLERHLDGLERVYRELLGRH